MNITLNVVVTIGAASLAGCAPLLYADPQEITLAQALEQTACGLATYRNSLSRYRVRPGTLTDTVEINFQVKGSAKNNSDLVLDTKLVPTGPFQALGLNYANRNETFGERSNSIKILMRNMYTTQLNAPGAKVVQRDGPGLRTDPYSPVIYEKPCEPETSPWRVQGPDTRAANYERLTQGLE